jgi:peptidyl-prolyl cis-trans isomerase D
MALKLDSKRLVSLLFILAIAVVFITQFGPGSRGCDAPVSRAPSAYAARVNGKEIPLQEYVRAYHEQLSWFRMQGQQIPESLVRQLGLPRQALDRLVNTELLAQAAEKEGIVPADSEIRELLRKNPDFQKDGKFDLERYKQVVRDYYRRSDSEYESDLRRQLAAQKLLDLVAATAVVSDEEVKAKFLRDADKANATLVRFLPATFASKVPKAKPQDIDAYRKDHSKEISDYYQANRFLFQQPERVRARHILLKLDKDAPPEAKQKAREKLEQIRKEIGGGKSFAQAAKEYSEDPGSKETGGDLGFNERANWVPEFANVAFALKPGELSQPVETQFGLHLIQAEEKKPAENKALKDVEEEIARRLYNQQQAKQLAEAAADKALRAAEKSGKALKQLYPAESKDAKEGKAKSQEDKPAAQETGPYSFNGDNVPQLGAAPELARDIFAQAQPRLLNKAYSFGDALVLVQVTERLKPSDDQFTQQKTTLRSQAIQAKQLELRDSYLKALRKGADIQINDQAVGSVASSS